MTTQPVTAPSRQAGVHQVMREAAAYRGAAHGMEWSVDGSLPPPDTVLLAVAGRLAWYRLARHPGTRRPALDWHGRLLYVPAPTRGGSPIGLGEQADGKQSPAARPTPSWDSLTESELKVAQLAADGLTNSEIAARLVISPHIVVLHLRHLLTKLRARSRVDLSRMARIRESRSGLAARDR